MSDFQAMDLDPRLTRAIAKLGFAKPTLVQETAIPLALQGKDILAQARTGSGKTAAYCIPAIQKILSKVVRQREFMSQGEQSIQCLVLVPTRELALQVTKVIQDLCLYCSKEVKAVNIAVGDVSLSAQILREHLEAGNVVLRDSIESLIVDEADLILSYGYDEDVTQILKHLPQIYQSYLMSATLSEDVDKLKKLILRKPAILKLEESEEQSLLTQYYINCSDEEKYLLTLFMLKLRVHPFGSHKSLIFVNSIDKCYKLKLFLEQFGIMSCALNSELPVKSRYHIVQEFNRGIYDFIIATDEFIKEEAEDEQDAAGNDGETRVPKPKKRKHMARRDGEYGVSRGIDFKNVSSVINFDMPRSSRSYQHRVGRTARGVGNKGYALTFVCPPAQQIIHTRKKIKGSASNVQLASDEQILARIEKRQQGTATAANPPAMGQELLPFGFDMTPVEKFRYRCSDALRSVTDAAIREARVKELKMEILNSEKLKTHFEDHPTDLAALRHDKAIHPTKIQPHMRHVPDYLLPKGKVIVSSGSASGHVPFHVDNKRRGKRSFKKAATATSKRKADPLKSLKYSA
ncbi:ATP-dependent DNA/RNA helicase [Kappamyces sp. JEL0680]|nr:ATP-dependent DNA/RNA helicase [Kappamyces sp. JEL0680]